MWSAFRVCFETLNNSHRLNSLIHYLPNPCIAMQNILTVCVSIRLQCVHSKAATFHYTAFLHKDSQSLQYPTKCFVSGPEWTYFDRFLSMKIYSALRIHIMT